MDDIRSWLNSSRNYDEGVKLLLQHCSDAKIKRLYTIEGPSDFKKQLLYKELQKIYTSKETTHRTPATQNPKLEIQNPSKWPATMDEVVAALFNQWKPLFAERNALCSRHYEVAKQNEKESGKMAHRILDLDDEIDLIYEQRDYYLQHGRLPEKKVPKKLAVDPLRMVVNLKNAERYVRAFKIKVKNEPANVKAAAKLKEWEDTVIYYKRELKINE
jgi:hypothetical protein